MYVVYVTCGILPSPPPFPKDYYYIIIKSKRFKHVKNKDDNRTRRACHSHHQCSPFCRCGRSRVSPDSLRFQPAPACSPCCSEIFAVSLTADQLLVARMAVSEIKCNKNLVKLQKRNKSSCEFTLIGRLVDKTMRTADFYLCTTGRAGFGGGVTGCRGRHGGKTLEFSTNTNFKYLLNTLLILYK